MDGPSASAALSATAGASAAPSATNGASASPSRRPTPAPSPVAAFAIDPFVAISERTVDPKAAAKFQTALEAIAAGGGTAATVMTADGTWSGATGKADGVRDLTANDQFAIASITKSVTAVQVMQLVEAGKLALDDPAADHLPPDVDFDSNEATIRQLLGMRSGIPDFDHKIVGDDGSPLPLITNDLRRRWTARELLQLVGPERVPVGTVFEYSSTNYVLLGLIIEQVSGRSLAEALRNGVLKGDGFERLILQPEEVPTEPMAMPDGSSTAVLKKGGGYLPSMALASAGHAAYAMASDPVSLARWWRALCAGRIVSLATLTEMSIFPDKNNYGLGVFDIAEGYARSIGHAGWQPGYVSWAGCMPDDGSVVVVLANHGVDDIGGMGRPLVLAAR